MDIAPSWPSSCYAVAPERPTPGTYLAQPCHKLGPTLKLSLKKPKMNLKFNLSLSESDRLRFELQIYPWPHAWMAQARPKHFSF